LNSSGVYKTNYSEFYDKTKKDVYDGRPKKLVVNAPSRIIDAKPILKQETKPKPVVVQNKPESKPIPKERDPDKPPLAEDEWECQIISCQNLNKMPAYTCLSKIN
jgi:hypothetical protein